MLSKSPFYNDVDFNNKCILITGGGGFIGSNLAFYLQNRYPALTLLFLTVLEVELNFPMEIYKALVTTKI